MKYPKIPVYAIVRIDYGEAANVACTVVKVLPNLAQADQEVIRLNDLAKENLEKHGVPSTAVLYTRQTTRYFSEGYVYQGPQDEEHYTT